MARFPGKLTCHQKLRHLARPDKDCDFSSIPSDPWIEATDRFQRNLKIWHHIVGPDQDDKVNDFEGFTNESIDLRRKLVGARKPTKKGALSDESDNESNTEEVEEVKPILPKKAPRAARIRKSRDSIEPAIPNHVPEAQTIEEPVVKKRKGRPPLRKPLQDSLSVELPKECPPPIEKVSETIIPVKKKKGRPPKRPPVPPVPLDASPKSPKKVSLPTENGLTLHPNQASHSPLRRSRRASEKSLTHEDLQSECPQVERPREKIKNKASSIEAESFRLENQENEIVREGLSERKRRKKKSKKFGSSSESENEDSAIQSLKTKVSLYADIMMRGPEAVSQVLSNRDKRLFHYKDKIASKIERLLRSQWEERLKKLQESSPSPGQRSDNSAYDNRSIKESYRQSDHSMSKPGGLPSTSESPAQKSSKNILKKARLQLTKKTIQKIRHPRNFQNLMPPAIPGSPLLNTMPNFSPATFASPLAQFTVSPAANVHSMNLIQKFAKQGVTARSPRVKNKEPKAKSAPTPAKPSKKIKEKKEKDFINSGQPGFVTCAICGVTKYYSHVQRRYGQFSCEPCSKFFARFLRDPKQFYCQRNGDCPIAIETRVVSSTPLKAASARCKACWLKVCLQKYAMDTKIRETISFRFAPKLLSSPNVSLITVDTAPSDESSGAPVKLKREIQNVSSTLLMVAREEDSDLNLSDAKSHSPVSIKKKSLSPTKVKTPAQKKEASSQKVRGPRIKHVCRSQHVIKGLPRATFSVKQRQPSTSPKRVNVSSNGHLPSPSTIGPNFATLASPKSPLIPKVSSAKNNLQKKKKSSVIANSKSHKKSNKITNQLSLSDVQPITNYSPIVKSPKQIDQNGTSKGSAHKKLARCKNCVGCLAEDCGSCVYCLDKKKFGGPNIIKQACKFRKCVLFSSPNRTSPSPVISPKSPSIKKPTKIKKTKANDISDKQIPPPKSSKKIRENLVRSKTNAIKRSISDATESDATSSTGNRVSLGFLLTAGNSGHGKPSLSGANLRNGNEINADSLAVQS